MGSRDNHRVQSVLHLLNNTLKQERFCNNACVERFLEARGDSVKKAAKHLRNTLSWRRSFAVVLSDDFEEHLMADEFCAELTEGMAYVAGHDHHLRPVMIFRIKQDYQKLHSHKLFTRLLVFTLEVAVQTMAKNVEQFVLLFDASLFRSAPSFMNMLIGALKIIGDHYPRRLHKAFVIDPPSLFSYLWKGVRPFVELSPAIVVVSSLHFEELYIQESSRNNFDDPSSRLGSSSRFSFTVSHHFDSLKPWHLSLKDASESKSSHAFLGPRISTLNARSVSFASPVARGRRGNIAAVHSTPTAATPKPWFLQSPALFFGKERGSSESFGGYLEIYHRPYDEMIYRSRMRPPLGGLISIVSPQFRRPHISISQRFSS